VTSTDERAMPPKPLPRTVLPGQEAPGRAARASATARRRGGELRAWIEQRPTPGAILDLAVRLYERDREAAGTIVGSAVAFRLFLFFVPTLLVVVGLAGFASAHVAAEGLTSSAGLSGALAAQIQAAFAQSSTARWFALLAGLVGMATSGRSLARGLVLMSALSWQVPTRGQRATVRITATVVGIMLSITLCAILVNLVRAELGLVVAGLSFAGVAVAYFVAWLALAMVLPRSTNDPGALLPGAALVGVAMAVVQAFTQLYLPDRVSQASSLYGGLGVTIVTLGWFFIIGRLAVLSMTINAVLYERLGSLTTLVFALPLLRALPPRSPRLARFFGLTGLATRRTPGAGRGAPEEGAGGAPE
jgi:uncharacterized BrkB/YihY/UPF0761 family membrane protein